MKRALIALLVTTAALSAPLGASSVRWTTRAPLPLARTEVSAAVLRGEIAVVGGFVADGNNSARVDLYSPGRNTWRRLPDLPVSVDHSTAATLSGRLYVAGGYGQDRQRLRSAWVFNSGAWRALPAMPEARAAAGAAIVGGKLYVVGGVAPDGLARRMVVFDPARSRWSILPGPTPREHLAVTGAKGRVYAVGGRTAGLNTNLRVTESYAPGARSWRRLAPVPQARGGTAAAVSGNTLVSAGGEAPQGTLAIVYGLDLRTGRWRRLADLGTPRHGLGLAALGGRVYAIGGGPRPGLFVSNANESLAVR